MDSEKPYVGARKIPMIHPWDWLNSKAARETHLSENSFARGAPDSERRRVLSVTKRADLPANERLRSDPTEPISIYWSCNKDWAVRQNAKESRIPRYSLSFLSCERLVQ